MERRLQAVYKQGALYPLEPLQLQDMQKVTLQSPTLLRLMKISPDTLLPKSGWKRRRIPRHGTRCGWLWPEFPARCPRPYPLNGKSVDCRSLRADLVRGRLRVGPPIIARHYQVARTLLVKFGATEGLRTLDALQLAIALNLKQLGQYL